MPISREAALRRAAKGVITRANNLDAAKKKSREKAFADHPFVVLEILRCNGPCGGYMAVAVDHRRITDHKCAGSWQTIGSARMDKEGFEHLAVAATVAYDRGVPSHVDVPNMGEFVSKSRRSRIG